jgi:aerobic carbon-monoxide dehydrogenase medium subunit
MKPAAFRYHRPATLEQALTLLAEHGDAAKPIAGGQSLVPMMNLRLAQPAELVDLGNLAGLDVVREVGDEIEIGALARHQTLADSELLRHRCPLLAEAAAGIGHYAIRQRGTLGGSLAHADPAAQLPLVAATVGGTIEVASARGRRVVPAADFFVAVMTTTLAADELVVALRIPAQRQNEGAAFTLFSRRCGDFAIVSVAASLALKGGRVECLRLGVGGVEPAPAVLAELAASQVGRVADGAWVTAIAAAAREAVDAQDDERISALYRRELTETLVTRALHTATQRAHERHGASP